MFWTEHCRICVKKAMSSISTVQYVVSLIEVISSCGLKTDPPLMPNKCTRSRPWLLNTSDRCYPFLTLSLNRLTYPDNMGQRWPSRIVFVGPTLADIHWANVILLIGPTMGQYVGAMLAQRLWFWCQPITNDEPTMEFSKLSIFVGLTLAQHWPISPFLMLAHIFFSCIGRILFSC